MYLALKTDSNISEYYLIKPSGKVEDKIIWESGRDLADGILKKLLELLENNGIEWDSIKGLIVFKGPGSFTGLRIGVTVANSISYSKKVPIIGEIGPDWMASGVSRLNDGNNDKQVVPEYGSEPNITKPVK